MHSLIAVVLFWAAGLPLAAAITRSPLLSCIVAPLASAVIATSAVLLTLIGGGSLGWWLVATYVAHLGLVALLIYRGRRDRRGPLPHCSPLDILSYVLPLLPPMLLVFTPPVGWDAHSIWWAHAGYFSAGGQYARDAIGNPEFAFSHPDYPPLTSATVAAAWTIMGDRAFRTAQLVVTLATASATMLLGYAVRRVCHAAPPALARLAAAGVGLAVWCLAPATVVEGLSDPLWSTAIVAAAVLLLIGDDPLDRPALPLLLLAVTALTKNESFMTTVVLACLVTLKYRQKLPRVWPVWVPVAAGVLWMGIARALGAKSDVPAGRVANLLAGDRGLLQRFPPTATALWQAVGPIVATAFVTAVLGTILLGDRRRALRLGSDLWLWGVAAAYFAMLTTTYLITPNEIDWYLATSINRVSLPFVLLAAASAACWGVTAVSRAAAVPTSSTRDCVSIHPAQRMAVPAEGRFSG